MTPDPEFNPQFEHAYRLMTAGARHLFITGRAGVGKSTLLAYFCAQARHKPVVLAPTGVAALNVGGQTIHNFFNFYVDVTPEKIRRKKVRPRRPALYRTIRTIIIDEVSMLRADLLDCVDAFLRLYGPAPGSPFGGVQMVFIGDLHQLPPVVTARERDIFSGYYDTPYFFSARALEEIEVEQVELVKVYRQQDQDFIDLLNRVRSKSLRPGDLARLNSRCEPDFSPTDNAFYITLTTTNARADQINEAHLQALPGATHHAEAEISGDFGREYYPTAPDLTFKPGAQIMLLNNDQRRRWVNGSVGLIQSIGQDEDGETCLRVLLRGRDAPVTVRRFVWEVFRFSVQEGALVSEPAGAFTQFPFRLAWAVTIHKGQGKTFERVIIDIGKGAFSAGQTYVALSRCVSLEGIVLRRSLRERDIRTDQRIMGFLAGEGQKDRPALDTQGREGF